MPTPELMAHLTGQYGPAILFTIAFFLAAEVLVLVYARLRSQHRSINSRLHMLAQIDDRQAALEELRRYRGLSAQGHQSLPFATLNRLITQSGIRLTPGQIAMFAIIVAAVVGAAAHMLLRSWPPVVLSVLNFGVILPILLLRFLRSRRLRQFENQLPEAVDVMVRSLRAGHPEPVAVAMVGREMPDPIGSEFGMASDEMTYGRDLETAMVNLRERTGQGDLGFLLIAISIQSKTGGNLAEILSNLSRLMRERFKMRRKIHAISAEGRFSAIGLSIVPIVVVLALRVLSPSYYSEVADHPIFMPVVYFTFGLWLTGILIMRRMVKFKF